MANDDLLVHRIVFPIMERVLPPVAVLEANVRVIIIRFLMKFGKHIFAIGALRIMRILARPIPQYRQLIDRTIAGFPPEIRVEFDEDPR